MENRWEWELLERLREGLDAAVRALAGLVPGEVKVEHRAGRGPVTDADKAANRVLREVLVRAGEGWLSEESVDDLERLERRRVWVVDPLDGTREFVAGIPEWCVSVGMVENGRAIAGGICNPATGEIFLGSLNTGVTWNGRKVRTSERTNLARAVVLASRTEVERGDWDRFRDAPFVIRPVGSIAYKLALVAAGLADAIWTLSPKNEWDVAAGVALVEAAGGFARTLAGSSLAFNKEIPSFSGLLAGGPCLQEELAAVIHAQAPPQR